MKRRLFFPIGEFAKIVGVNKRTLHYYDAQGIFRPDHVAPNGYRSYSFRQFYPFYRLRMMRSMGLELAEIRDYMEHRSPERLDQLLGRQQEWLKRELDGMKRSLRIVENQRRLLSLSRTIVCGRVAERSFRPHGSSCRAVRGSRPPARIGRRWSRSRRSTSGMRPNSRSARGLALGQ